MKKAILKRLEKLKSFIEGEAEFFDEERQNMQERYDNMSENRQASDAGEALAEEVSQLDSVYDALQALLDACGDIETDL